ncbi:MAG: hypothetical protein K6L76_02080 [Agarilytica sp.]
MVDSIRPTYRTVTPQKVTERVKESSAVETHSDDKEAGQDYIVNKDRRQVKERRKRGGQKRSLYDMRTSRGRRKEDRGDDSIEIKV